MSDLSKTDLHRAQKAGVCPAPITLVGLDGPVRVRCERGWNHHGPHLAAGVEFAFDHTRKGGSRPRITRVLTRKGFLR